MAPTTKKVKEKDEHKCPHCSKVLIDRSSYLLHQKLHTDQYPFSCSICPYKCKIKKYLARHVKKTHNQANGPYCPVCGKVFHFLSNLKNHMRVHTGEKPFKCQVCGKAFSSNYCLSMHKLIHTDEKPFQCSFCDYACRDNSTLRKHQERHMGIYKTYPCEKCKKIFKTSTSLRLHIDEVHRGLNTRTFGCDKCDKAFKTKATLRIHVKAVHDKSLRTECDICGQNISKSSVGNHLNTHVDIRPFKCSFKHCGKKFKERGSLKKHTLIHYPEHQYQCDLCDCRFPRKSRLRDHKLRHTANGGYTCDYCGVSFSTKRYLLSHIKKMHSKNSEKFICDVCGLINYSKRAIILHLRYGHGSEHDRKCQICSAILKNSKVLTDHYWKTHNVRFVVQKKKGDKIVIKDEPIEVLAEFDFDYDVQKIEVDEYIPDPHYADTETTLAYSEKVLAEDISRNIGTKDSEQHPETRFDEIYMEHVVDKPGVGEHIMDPEYVQTETTLPYSKGVLEEDISRSILERDKGHQPESEFDKFFVQVMNKPKKKDLPKEKVDKRKLKVMKKTIKKMLCDSKLRKETDNLEKIRRQYNWKIKMANKSSEKKEPKQIKYFNKSDNNTENTQNNINSLSNDDDQELTQDDDNDDRPSLKTEENDHENDSNQANDKLNQDNGETNPGNDETNQENNIAQYTNDIEDENINDKTIAKRTRRQRRIKGGDSGENHSKDVYYGEAGDNGEKTNKNEKLTFIGHECYICFKIFKTKNDLKIHCKEHFDICNEKMLTKCPFCGFVTNRNIKRHIELVHKININYAYGQVTEKTSNNGSKYVFEIDKDCELEIIPSISNLNKIACMKFDEKNRQNKNVFMGKTKLVKKGSNWIIEKERLTVTNEYLLPEFTEEEYKSLKIDGDSYLDGIKLLSRLAKRKGLKMLYPCSDCEKICQTLSALKLHSRRHETNPKRFKPKVWVNRHIEYKTKNRKRIRCSNKTKNKIKEAAAVKKAIRRGPVKVIEKTDVILDNRKNKFNFDTENRFAAPKPVRNKHKCDKQLIEFYNSNIKGKDIEFWQFLKIFNKMGRENVNDFEDLENRNDAHFGVHIKEKTNEPVDTDTVPVTVKIPVTETVTVTETVPVTESAPVIPKTTGMKNAKKKFTRAIMISKKEYMRRNEIKNQMRKKIEENK